MRLLLGVVSVLALLALMAWPNVSAEKKRVRQANEDLAALSAAETAYRAAHGNYLAVPRDDAGALSALGFSPQLSGWAHYEVVLVGAAARVGISGSVGESESPPLQLERTLP